MSSSEREARLDEVLAAYLEAQGHGWGPDRRRLLECYPHLADDLRRFFADEDRVERAAVELRKQSEDTASGPSGGPLPVDTGWPTLPGYEMLEELARGGFGVVYKARQVQADRVVALKMILSGKHASESERRRFRGEIEAVARLRHPGVVQIYEVGEHDGLPFFSMEFCDGGSLADLLNGTPLPPTQAATVVQALAEAIHAAHEHNLVHRDIKPANVLLVPASGRDDVFSRPEGGANWMPKIADFGLARDLQKSGQTATGAILGTPSYIAPEQAASQHHPVGPAADVYGLGAILYECLTGRPPFKGPTGVETVLQVLHDEPVSVRQLQPKTPRDLETICHKCLQKDPARRYASAHELGEDLGRFHRGEPVEARPVGPLERGWRWCRRHPMVASLGALVLLTLSATAILGGVVAWQQAENANRQAELSLRATGETARAQAEAAAAAAARKATNVQLERARSTLLTAQLARVDQIADRDPMRALELLHDTGSCPLDLRDAAWRYYEGICSRWTHATLKGHTDVVWSVAFCPDGHTLASGSQDGTVRLWDVGGGRELTCFRGQGLAVGKVAFSPDGQTLAWGTGDGAIELWDVAGGRRRTTLRGHAGLVTSLAFSPDGRSLASGSFDKKVKVWDVTASREKADLKGHSGPVRSVAYSPDGRTLASAASDKTVRLWDVAEGRQKASLEGHSDSVTSVAFSPDGNSLASGSNDHTVRLWDVASGRERASLGRGHTFAVWSLAFSPDGLTLASGGSDQTVKVWEVATGQERATLRGHSRVVSSLAYSPDGKSLASGSGDKTVRLWRVAGSHEQVSLKAQTSLVKSLAFSPDGGTLAAGNFDRTVKLWDMTTGRERATLEDNSRAVWNFLKGESLSVWSVAFSPDGRALASGSEDQIVRLWDVASGRVQRTLKGHTGSVTSLAFSPDGQSLATGSKDRTIKLWDWTRGLRRATFEGHTDEVVSVTFSPNGRALASASRDKTVKLWDLANGRERATLKGHNGTVNSVAFSPDGDTLASGSDDGSIRMWDVAGTQARACLTGHPLPVESVAFSSDGRTLASGSIDGTVKLWDVSEGQERATLKGHSKAVLSVTFSPDNRCLASSSWDGEVKLWDVASRREVDSLRSDTGEVTSTAFSSDGTRLLSHHQGDHVIVWDLRTGQRLDETPPQETVPGPVSPDGRLRADIEGDSIRLIDLTWVPPLFPTRPKLGTPDPDWHAEQAESAEREKRWFAAGFHLGKLADLRPWNPDLRLREARAWVQAGEHERAALAFLAAAPP